MARARRAPLTAAAFLWLLCAALGEPLTSSLLTVTTGCSCPEGGYSTAAADTLHPDQLRLPRAGLAQCASPPNGVYTIYSPSRQSCGSFRGFMSVKQCG